MATKAERTIKAIDADIDANERALRQRHSIRDTGSPVEWQAAWDACPDLFERTRVLFLERDALVHARGL